MDLRPFASNTRSTETTERTGFVVQPRFRVIAVLHRAHLREQPVDFVQLCVAREAEDGGSPGIAAISI